MYAILLVLITKLSPTLLSRYANLGYRRKRPHRTTSCRRGDKKRYVSQTVIQLQLTWWAGHKVTALLRNPTSLTANDSLKIVQGNPLNKSDIEKALLASTNDVPQAIIVTLNATRESDSPFAKPVAPSLLVSDSVRNARQVMQTHGLKKLVIMSAVGVGDSFPSLNFLMKPIIKYTNMALQYHDHNVADDETRASDLDWVLVRPVMLKQGDAQPVKHLGNKGEDAGFMPSISRASVASFLVDAVENNTWDKSTPVICN